MKKAKFIILMLTIVVLLMGAGYAYWTETLTIINTVNTGELRIEFIEEYGDPSINGVNEAYLDLGKKHGGKTTTFTIGHMYPGSSVTYEAYLKNLGTIPATIEDVNIDFISNSSELLKENIMVTVDVFNYCSYYEQIGPIALKSLGGELNNRLSDIIELTPDGDDQELFITAHFNLPPEVENELEEQTVKFDLTFNFKQFNK